MHRPHNAVHSALTLGLMMVSGGVNALPDTYSFQQAHALVSLYCQRCHSGSSPAGGFDILQSARNRILNPALRCDQNREPLEKCRNSMLDAFGTPVPRFAEYGISSRGIERAAAKHMKRLNLPPRKNQQGQLIGPAGQGQDIVFQFSQSGATLTGKQYADYKSAPIIEGQIAGDQIKFTVVMPKQAGTQTNTARYSHVGTIKGDQLEMTRERPSSVNVGNGEIAPNRITGPQSFVLKRLI